MEKEGGDGREKDSRTSSRMDDCIVYVSLSVSGCLSVSACLSVRLHRNIFKERDPMRTRRPQREKREGGEEEEDFFKETEQDRGGDRANERLGARELPLFLPCAVTPTLSLSVSPEASLGLVLALAQQGTKKLNASTTCWASGCGKTQPEGEVHKGERLAEPTIPGACCSTFSCRYPHTVPESTVLGPPAHLCGLDQNRQ